MSQVSPGPPQQQCPLLGSGAGGGVGVGAGSGEGVGVGSGEGVGTGTGMGAGETVQSKAFGDAHPEKLSSADGHVEPSGQHWLPAHILFAELGQATASPTEQEPDGGGEGVGAGVGAGVGDGGGDGVGTGVGTGDGMGPPLAQA